ncbi:GNAT family N-acetyltransferase [Virgibacillus alimentarius]|uniref:GNAT superfamily N-acetyltransferase n=1 Tax=Virgibacillus alimentarius TaxID=698769 RepID=A0ABS4SBW7_9BACI|nr:MULTISPECIES: GNAT family N-acetyltransferase [Virgibacillus]MBP2259011.1 GNAT superfamily N-acetyltransferase [Virgibacillus alimentarius]HLR68728.1 GNAT family N-acetyltransferase [Virgibacillus sp.]
MSEIKATPNLGEHMTIQRIKPEDLEEVAALSKKCFGPDMSLTRDNFENQLKIFPEGQVCLRYKDKIVGSASSLVINFDDYGENHSYTEISDDGYIRNHNPNGVNLYGIEVGVHPDFRKMKIGKHLYFARREICKELNLKSIIIGGRIPNYYKYANQFTPDEYANEVIQEKIYDPVLTFQHKNGFQLRKVMQNYLMDDDASLTNATLMEWHNPDFA